MQDNHPVHLARFAVDQQIKRLSAWYAADQRKAAGMGQTNGPDSVKIAQRAEELTDLSNLLKYTLRLEQIIIEQEQELHTAKQDYYHAGYARHCLDSTEGLQIMTQVATTLIEQKTAA